MVNRPGSIYASKRALNYDSFVPSLLSGAILFAAVLASVPATAAEPDTAQESAAQDSTDSASDSATTDDTTAAHAETQQPEDTRISSMQNSTAQIRALLAGTLDPAVPPNSLFEVPLDDEPAIDVETRRLTAIVRQLSPEADTESQTDSDSQKVTIDTDKSAAQAEDTIEERLLAARLELDAARLTFYELSKPKRSEILSQHEQRRTAVDTTRQSVNQAKARAQQAEIDQKIALEAALRARSEAARLVAEEQARLLGIAKEQAELESKLSEQRAALEQRAEVALGLRRRVKELLADKVRVDPDAADALYTELRTFLRATRMSLSSAMFEVISGLDVPGPGPDQLVDLPAEVDRTADKALREKAVKTEHDLEAMFRTLRWDSASQLYDETRGLNDDRLVLLRALSPAKRAALTGFQSAGWDQALAEVTQVTLVMRYHALTAWHWLTETVRGESRSTWSYLAVLATAGKWILLLAAFFWWRRRANETLKNWRTKALEDARRRRAVNTGWIESVASFALRVRGPVEWLILVLGLHAALPEGASNQLEVQLLLVVLVWTIGGAVAVSILDAFARQDAEGQGTSTDDAASLRLRSLRVVGRTVVAFGLILSLTARMVGSGTIYDWVLSTCWIASLPVGLLLVAWWRAKVFTRIEARRKKNSLEAWIISRQSGGASFIAAFVGGVYLVVRGVLRVVRAWVSRFDITRRALAYLFRRGLDKLATDRPRALLHPLSQELFAALGPETSTAQTVASGAEEQIERIVARIREKGGGVFAIVGERGLGKTTTVNGVAKALSDVDVVSCPIGGIDELSVELARIAKLAATADLLDSAAVLDAKDKDSGLIIDDAHRLIRPVIGGLEGFDRLLEAARHHSANCTWVFALDEVVWRFFERARGSKPVFDDVVWLEPWREEEIVELLTVRTVAAGIEPNFEELLVGTELQGDEIDRREALDRVRTGYYRLLWDYASGNPGVALHMWRKSLGMSQDDRVYVKFFHTPDARELEELPDSTAFVLRATIQLEAALPQDIAMASMLGAAQVENALRYGLVRGYFSETAGRYKVTWAWYRAMTHYLRRRHLLAAGR